MYLIQKAFYFVKDDGFKLFYEFNIVLKGDYPFFAELLTHCFTLHELWLIGADWNDCFILCNLRRDVKGSIG